MADKVDSRTEDFLKAELAAGRPIANEGTFRIVDDEGHIEVMDPAGPPGTILYDRFNKDGLVEHAMTRVVNGDLQLKDDPDKMTKAELVKALSAADKK
jgi:hypothetical protein